MCINVLPVYIVPYSGWNDFTFPPYRDIILCLQADD